jgi:hypothetical protein
MRQLIKKLSKKAAPKTTKKAKRIKRIPRAKRGAKKLSPSRMARLVKAVVKAAKKKTIKKKAIKKAPKRPRRIEILSAHYPNAKGKKTNFVYEKNYPVRPDLQVKKAQFLRDKILYISFSNGQDREVDFSSFLNDTSIPSYLKIYKSEELFRNFRIEEGNVVWGEDWDLIFPVEQLYSGKIVPFKNSQKA